MDSEEYFLINGKKPLSGEIEIKGCKNSAVSVIAATLLTKEPCYIHNLPRVRDVLLMLKIIESLGAKVSRIGKREVKIECKNIDPEKIDKKLVKKLRSSVFLIGPLISRFKKMSLPQPGGCLIGVRSIDVHIKGFLQLGVKVKTKNDVNFFSGKKIKAGEVVLSEFSVTATENILMASSLLSGKTTIKIAAIEPHVMELSSVLSKMGAEIKWKKDHTVEIKGQKKLNGFSHFVEYDAVEAGSFIILAGSSGGDIIIKNVPLDQLSLTIEKLKDFGISIEKIKKNDNVWDIRVIKGKFLPVSKVQVLPYPGIPTDLQCAFGVLATQNPGETLIHDPMYEGRLKYLNDLNRMGAEVSILDSHRAIIRGQSSLNGVSIKNYDLRSGASFIIAALLAEGKSTISNIYQIDRGYEDIEKRLQKIGADIKRIK